MSQNVRTAREVPTAPYYVLSHDIFMSGWGPCRGLINTVIVPCEDWTVAWEVARYARGRSDQRRVRIASRKPRLRPGHFYSLMSREDAPAWYNAD